MRDLQDGELALVTGGVNIPLGDGRGAAPQADSGLSNAAVKIFANSPVVTGKPPLSGAGFSIQPTKQIDEG